MLDDFERADVRPELAAMLRFLKKMTLEPEHLDDDDGKGLRDEGVSRGAAIDGIEVGFAFNLLDRLADAFDFDIPSPEAFAKTAPLILRHGYKF